MTVRSLQVVPPANDQWPEHLLAPRGGQVPLPDLVGRLGREHPSRTAVVSATGAADATYRDLSSRSARAAAGLAALAVRPGDTVAVVGDSGVDQTVAIVATLATGARVLPLPAAPLGSETRDVVERLGILAEIRVTDTGLPPLKGSILVTLPELISTSPASAPPPPDLTSDPARAGFVCLTSGTQSAPKAVNHTHAALVQLATWMAEHHHLTPDDRIGQWSLPGYDAQLVETATALIAGGSLHPLPSSARLDPAAALIWLAEHRITWFQTVPSFARALVAEARRRHLHLSLHTLVLAGEPLTGDLADSARADLGVRRVVNLYGSSETILATSFDVPPDAGSAPVPVGTPIPGRDVLLIDAHGQRCREGQTGEIVIKTPYLAEGHGERLGDATVYRTGDRGRWERGNLVFRGRSDDVVKVAGRRVRLSAVESLLRQVPGVQECAVLPIVDSSGLTEQLVAHIEAPAAASGLRRDIRDLLREQLAGGAPPLRIRDTDRLPRNRGGKVDRAALQTSSAHPPDPQHTAINGSTP